MRALRCGSGRNRGLVATTISAVLLLSGCVSQPDTAPVALFNGVDLAGWDCFLAGGAPTADAWHVADGLLVCDGDPRGYLYTTRDYQDYRLVVEWRWPGEPGNSGVLLRVVPAEQVLPSGAEAQLRSGSAGDIMGFHDFVVGGDPARLSEIRLPGFRLTRLEAAEREPGKWNRYEITVAGDRITVVLNGALVNEATGCTVRPGRIALQSEGGVVHFRTVELTPLAPAPQ